MVLGCKRNEMVSLHDFYAILTCRLGMVFFFFVCTTTVEEGSGDFSGYKREVTLVKRGGLRDDESEITFGKLTRRRDRFLLDAVQRV